MKRHLKNCFASRNRHLYAKLPHLVLSIGLMGMGLQAGALDEGARLTPAWGNQKKGETTRVSVASNGMQGNDYSHSSRISADGRYVVFDSDASNLVSEDTNGYSDVFVHDRNTGKTIRVSVGANGVQGDGGSHFSMISADGRYVAFESSADNLVSGDTNGVPDIFVHDRKTGQTTRVSVASDGTKGNADSYSPEISANGRYVAFTSYADNLVPSDTNSRRDIFVHDRQTGKTARVSVASNGAQGNGFSDSPAISADGRFVAFESWADDLVVGDTNGAPDIFVHDRQTGKTTRVSVASNGVQSDGFSYHPAISADGRYVAFVSEARNLVAGDTNEIGDIFIHDRQTGKAIRVSVSSNGAQAYADVGSDGPEISADGRFVTFYSEAYNLVAGDTNGWVDVFVHDWLTGKTTRVSVASDGREANNYTESRAISADGRYVVFFSDASNLVPGDNNGVGHIFVRDRLLLPNQKADLSVTQTQSVKTIRKGRPLTYTITVKNNGRDFASDVSLIDLVPLNGQLHSVTSSQGSCYQAPITICRLGYLAAGAQAKAKLTFGTNQTGVLNNTVYVNAPPKDLVTKNNTSTLSTQVR
jgi:uncharacterized repeat protein (TIGR01451 family)